MSDPFIGEIKTLGFNFAPRGYAFCWGQSMNLSQNQALFALLGTYYGGNGTSTFNLPDLRGRVAVGQGQSQTTGTVFNIGAFAGAETTQLTTNQLPTHTHAIQVSLSGLTAQTTIHAIGGATTRAANPSGNLWANAATVGTSPVNVASYAAATGSGGTAVTMDPTSASTVVSGSATAVAGTAGNGQPFTNLPPYLVINYSIALIGVFPTRS